MARRALWGRERRRRGKRIVKLFDASILLKATPQKTALTY
jgi:hypothetical protein